MTLAFIPLTIVVMPIENLQLFSVTLAFVALMPALYAAFIWWGQPQYRLQALAGLRVEPETS